MNRLKGQRENLGTSSEWWRLQWRYLNLSWKSTSMQPGNQSLHPDVSTCKTEWVVPCRYWSLSAGFKGSPGWAIHSQSSSLKSSGIWLASWYWKSYKKMY